MFKDTGFHLLSDPCGRSGELREQKGELYVFDFFFLIFVFISLGRLGPRLELSQFTLQNPYSDKRSGLLLLYIRKECLIKISHGMTTLISF